MDISKETHTLFEVDFRNHFLIVLLGLGWRQLPLALTRPSAIILDALSLLKEMTFQDCGDSKGVGTRLSQKEAEEGGGGGVETFLHAPIGPVISQNHGSDSVSLRCTHGSVSRHLYLTSCVNHLNLPS